MAKHVIVTETNKQGASCDRTARDEEHARRLTERILKANPTSTVTTKGGKR